MAEMPLNEAGLPEGYAFRDDWEVTPRQVKAMLDQGQAFVLIDCRQPREYHVAHIAGARLVPLGEFNDRLAELKAHADQKVVVHCHHGIRSRRMTAALRQAGFADVTSMAGGIDLWSRDIDASVPRY